MITKEQLLWGEYGGYSGFWLPGTAKLQVDASASEQMRRYFIGCVTEGASPDSFNGYDKCRFSGGRFQITEVCSGWLVSALIGKLREFDRSLIAPLEEAAAERGYTFENTPTRYGAWCWRDKDGPVHRSQAAQDAFFAAGGSGRIGSWNSHSEQAQAIIPFILAYLNIWSNPEAVRIQDEFLVGRMMNFIMSGGRSFMNLPSADKPYLAAAQAAYLSFSLNNPTIALRMLDRARAESKHQIGTREWTNDYLKLAVFGPKITIYPLRYNDARRPTSSIRYHLERLFGVDLPDMAADLAAWEDALPALRTIRTTADIQQALIDLGYDLKPRLADGIFGPKTTAAVISFQRDRKRKDGSMIVDGKVGPQTLAALAVALNER